jgi:two-component system, cell cycle response regulator DivK
MPHGSILLVEPPEDDRPMYAEFLRANGFSVTEVDSTDAGLSAAHAADLIVTGVRMPGSFDGIELVRRLRDGDRTKSKPLIVLTACTFEPDQSRAFAAGCDVFLPKPCLPEILLEEARRLLEHSRRPRRAVQDGSKPGRERLAHAQAVMEKAAATTQDHRRPLRRSKRR